MVSLPPGADQRPAPQPRRILDAHHHFWDRGTGHYPWLSEAHDFFLGDYAVLRQGNRLPTDYLAAAIPHPIVGTVHIEAERERSDQLGETHINVRVQLENGTWDWRRYSLVNFSTAPGATDAPAEYLIAVRLEETGRGGSRFMHQKVVDGTCLTIQAPRNDFPLSPIQGRSVLLGGGIGVTPMAAMAAHCRATDQAVTLHYAGRSRTFMALLPELSQLLGTDLVVHADDEQGVPLDIAHILDQCSPEDHVYVCGPQPMLDAVLAHTTSQGWAAGRVHFELFALPAATAGDRSFEVVLQQSGTTLQVPPNKTLLAMLNEAGCDVMFDCERGECGVCAVEVIEGDIDHRDYVLTTAEKQAGKVIHVCVSRCHSDRLVLHL